MTLLLLAVSWEMSWACCDWKNDIRAAMFGSMVRPVGRFKGAACAAGATGGGSGFVNPVGTYCEAPAEEANGHIDRVLVREDGGAA